MMMTHTRGSCPHLLTGGASLPLHNKRARQQPDILSTASLSLSTFGLGWVLDRSCRRDLHSKLGYQRSVPLHHSRSQDAGGRMARPAARSAWAQAWALWIGADVTLEVWIECMSRKDLDLDSDLDLDPDDADADNGCDQLCCGGSACPLWMCCECHRLSSASVGVLHVRRVPV